MKQTKSMMEIYSKNELMDVRSLRTYVYIVNLLAAVEESLLSTLVAIVPTDGWTDEALSLRTFFTLIPALLAVGLRNPLLSLGFSFAFSDN